MTKARSLFRKLSKVAEIGSGRIIMLIAVLFAASCAFADDLTVTENTSLNEDTTVDALVVSPGVTLDLNGYSLTANSIGTGKDHLIEGRYAPCNSVTAETAGPYILTDYKLKATDRVEARVQYAAANQILFGARTYTNSKNSNAFAFVLSSTANKIVLYYGSATASSITSTSAIEPNKDYIITMNGKTRKYSTQVVSGTGMSCSSTTAWSDTYGTSFTTHDNFAIFGCNTYNGTEATVGNKGRCTVYWLKVYDTNGTLKRCFIPVKDTNNGDTAGLYDTVAGKFHAPSGGSLAADGTSVSADLGEEVVVGGGDRGYITNNDSEAEATLTVNVSDGALTNTAVAITGNLKFVKSGEGTFVASCTNQTYTGGTEVNGGMLKCGVAGSGSPFGTGGVTVGAGGTLDMNGQTGYNDMNIIMAGGTLINSGTAIPATNLGIGNVHLTSNSCIAVTKSYPISAYSGSAYGATTIDLGGKTLSVTANGGNLYFCNSIISNGTLRIDTVPDSFVGFLGEDSRAVETDTDIEVTSGLFYPNVSLTGVRNLTFNGGSCRDNANSTGTVEVNGTFKTATSAFCNVSLSSGATLDLSENSGVFNVVSTISSTSTALTFPNSGTITVYTGNREIAADDQLVAWTAKPTCDFALTCEGASPAERQLKLVVQSDGLYIESTAVPRQATLKVTGYTGTDQITGFQALVKLSNADAYGFSYDEAETDGSDLWFEDSDGNVIPHEIDTWNTSGDSFVWVKIPTLTNNVEIVMHWGVLRTAAQTCTPSNTWSNFVGVWHMNEDGTTAEPDSTANGLDATPLDTSNAATSIDTTAGVVGTGRANENNKHLTVGSSEKSYWGDGRLTDTTKFSVSGWFQWATDSQHPRIVSACTSGSDLNTWEIFYYGNSGAAKVLRVRSGTETANSEAYFGNTEIPLGGSADYVYLTVVWNGASVSVYKNGSVQTQTSGSAKSESHKNPKFEIGGFGNTADRSFIGNFDEVRMFNGAMTADRAKADYDTMTTPTTFLTPRIVRAEWTGAADDGDVANPSNWNCYTEAGNEVASAGILPDASTDIVVSGDNLNFQVTSSTALKCNSLVLSNATLAANCDLCGLSSVTVANNAVINLNGHRLYVYGLKGDGLTFEGGGTVTLSGANTFTGVTTVEIGTTLVIPDTSLGGGLAASLPATTFPVGMVTNLVTTTGSGVFTESDFPDLSACPYWRAKLADGGKTIQVERVAPLMTVTDYDFDTGKITLGFENMDTALGVVVAWDSSDHDANLGSWPTGKSVILTNAVTAGATTWTFTLPAEARAADTYYRLFLGDGADTVYDEEVAWIQPDPSKPIGAYIKTEYKPTAGSWMAARINFNNQSYTDPAEVDFYHVGGYHIAITNTTSLHVWMPNSGNAVFPSVASANNAFSLRMHYVNTANNVLFIGSTGKGHNNFNWGTAADSPNPLYIFSNYGGTARYSRPILYSMSWTNSAGKVAADFIPVKKDSEYGLYDKIAKRLYLNAGAEGTSFRSGAGTGNYGPVTFADGQMTVSTLRRVGTLKRTALNEQQVTLAWTAPGSDATLWVQYSDALPSKNPSEWGTPVNLGNIDSNSTGGTYNYTSGNKSMRFIMATSGSTADKLDVIRVSKVYLARPKPVIFLVK